jgi:hypothetical protein
MQLRDGTTTADPRLDRLVQFDDRSRSFPIREVVGAKRERSYTWRCGPTLDQGAEGACVGFACAHELAARPSEVAGLTADYARGIYYSAQISDPWPGGEYPGASPRYSGTSVLAGVKVAQRLGYFESYRWAFGLSDLIRGLGHHGPAVLGLNWYSGMFNTDARGFIRPTGYLAGGHAILARAVNVKDGTVTLRNSWGPSWGRGGDCLISFADLDRLLHEQGEAVFFVKRKTTPY